MGMGRFIAAQFRRPSGWFGSLALGPLMNRANRRIVDSTLGLLELKPGQNVLEVGFGGGHGVARLAESVTEGVVHGVDFAPDMVRRAERRFRREIAEACIQVRLGDVSSLIGPEGPGRL